MPVRPGDANPELRCAVRSLEKHLAFDRLVIVGHCPPWLQPDLHIPTAQDRPRREHCRTNVLRACTDRRLSRSIIITWDDVHLVRPTPDPLPTWHAGPLAEAVERATGGYRTTLADTLDRLRTEGHSDLLAYDAIHRPQVYERAKLAAVIRAGYPAWSTAYGAKHRADNPGVRAPNAKSREHWNTADVVSTSDRMFVTHPMGAFVRAAFPTKSRWER